MVGAGSIPTRIFLLDLTDYLKEFLNKKKVYSEFHFLGSKEVEVRNTFDSIPKTGYKVILYFLPDGNSSWYKKEYKPDILGTFIGAWIFKAEPDVRGLLQLNTITEVSYKQNFILLLSIQEDSREVWAASLEVRCDPGQKRFAKVAAKRILVFLEENKYLKKKKQWPSIQNNKK